MVNGCAAAKDYVAQVSGVLTKHGDSVKPVGSRGSIDVPHGDWAVHISGEDAHISGFTIYGNETGAYLVDSYNNTVSGNRIVADELGIYIENVSNSSFVANSVSTYGNHSIMT